MLHRAAIPFVTQPVASCQAPGDALVLHLNFDIFCHLPNFFLTRSGGKMWNELGLRA